MLQTSHPIPKPSCDEDTEHILILDWLLHESIAGYLRISQYEDDADRKKARTIAIDFGDMAQDMVRTLNDLDVSLVSDRIELWKLIRVILERTDQSNTSSTNAPAPTNLASIIPTFLHVSGRMFTYYSASNNTTPDGGKPLTILPSWFDLFLDLQIQAAIECESIDVLTDYDPKKEPTLGRGVGDKQYNRYRNMRDGAWERLQDKRDKMVEEHPVDEFNQKILQFIGAVVDLFGPPMLVAYEERIRHHHPDFAWIRCSAWLTPVLDVEAKCVRGSRN